MALLTLWSAALFAAILVVLLTPASNDTTRHDPPTDTPDTTDAPDNWNILYHQGGNSPWIPKVDNIAPGGLDPPPGCHVDQVHILSRHAERYPTAKAGIRMLHLYHRLVQLNVTFSGPLEFLNTYDFFLHSSLSDLESLIPVGPYAGTLEAFATGTRFRTRYPHLLSHALARNQTTFWASSSARVAETARYFAAGLYGLSWPSIANLQIIPESPDRGANTLTPGTACTAYRADKTNGHDKGYSLLADWQAVYIPPIIRRLAPFTSEPVRFTLPEIYTMQEMCGFETLALGSSPWCAAFTPAEWLDFEYARDLLHYHRSGPGNPYGPALGWPLLNATLALLLAGPDAAGALYASFAHDGDLVPFLAALDLFPSSALDAGARREPRGWRTSDVVPMGGRVVLERVVCPWEKTCWANEFYPNHVYCTPEGAAEASVRVVVNDGVVPMYACLGGIGGTCPLKQFKEWVERKGREAGDFKEVCGLAEEAEERVRFLEQPEWKGSG